ncbi:MAG: hypothetical protein NT007_19320 [Candidatus Kapabacteria bacterium]|nr:hypothetical protein [Candidatus Kapabacteria bacterium]
MEVSEQIARFDFYLRRLALRLSPQLYSYFYSNGRKYFLKILQTEVPEQSFVPSDIYKQKLWDIEFNFPLFNSAGMFKNGLGYEVCRKQGAGAFLAGTSTSLARNGNTKNNIKHPFAPYPISGIASNWMGLPNEGHGKLAKTVSEIVKKKGCPLGVSLAIAPEQIGELAVEYLCQGLKLFNKANVDFIEINESCPNVSHEHGTELINGIDSSLIMRLEYVSQQFLKKRTRNLPVIVKFSNDTCPEQIPFLIEILISLGFDGANFGNTSTDYSSAFQMIANQEKKHFDYFINQFGGGLSGSFLKDKSLNLCSIASHYLANHQIPQEFHLIRTGGVDSPEDLELSSKLNIPLNQWFTGYFDNFARYGHNLYERLIK